MTQIRTVGPLFIIVNTSHPQRTGYMPSLLPPGTGYPDFTPMGETDEYLSWQMQQMQQQQIQRQMQEQPGVWADDAAGDAHGQREPARAPCTCSLRAEPASGDGARVSAEVSAAAARTECTAAERPGPAPRKYQTQQMQQQLADMECASLQWDVHWLSRLSPLAHWATGGREPS